MLTLCIPVLNRYDALEKCILSAENGTRKPDRYFIIDNGNRLGKLPVKNVDVYSPGYNIGVAASWNYFIKNTTEIRLISNDDIEFFSNSIEVFELAAQEVDQVLGCSILSNVNLFSLFTIPDSVVEAVGYFDETISPNYAYYEDNDYVYRMKQLNIYPALAGAMVSHFGSATLKAMNRAEQDEHHNKFKIATENYRAKWGGLPGHEKFTTPFGR